MLNDDACGEVRCEDGDDDGDDEGNWRWWLFSKFPRLHNRGHVLRILLLSEIRGEASEMRYVRREDCEQGIMAGSCLIHIADVRLEGVSNPGASPGRVQPRW